MEKIYDIFIKDDVKLQVDLYQNNQQWYFRLKGNYELELVKMIVREMMNADTFVDIGSKIGVYVKTIAQKLPDEKDHYN